MIHCINLAELVSHVYQKEPLGISLKRNALGDERVNDSPDRQKTCNNIVNLCAILCELSYLTLDEISVRFSMSAIIIARYMR